MNTSTHPNESEKRPPVGASRGPDDNLQATLAGWLARVAADRDRDAFDCLFNHFCPRLYNFMRRAGLGEAEAEDLVQETMVRIWTKAHQYRSTVGSVSTWVYTIARNLRVDNARSKVGGISWCSCEEVMEAPLPTDGETQVDALMLLDRVGQLSPEQLPVIELAYLDGLSQSEISSRLKVPLGTVKSRIRLAFQTLRHALGVAS